MKLEIHILQNFAPSNLNRDDTGSPKDCELGGVRRSRISSQCFKRAIRNTFVEQGLLDEAERAARTKRLVDEVASRVVALGATDEAKARRAAVKALEVGSLKAEPDTLKTQYLLFMPRRSLDTLAKLVSENLDTLGTEDAPKVEGENGDKPEKGPKAKAKSAKAAKAEAKEGANSDIKKAVEKILSDGARTPELALFGRMIANKPEWNVDAACQVAHAFSTNRVAVEFDFYTAIDDLKKDDTAGSDMMGTVAFNSACFYRYMVVDVGDLVKNLGGDKEAEAQARRTVSAFVRAAVLAIPTGKQNSMAAQNLPSLVLCDVRDKAEPRSLANAFVKPVRPSRDEDLVALSAQALAGYAAALDKVYGTKGRAKGGLAFISLDADGGIAKSFGKALPGAAQLDSLDDLVSKVTQAAFGAHA
jgi:CRISPR system Cascade subunit CasC